MDSVCINQRLLILLPFDLPKLGVTLGVTIDIRRILGDNPLVSAMRLSLAFCGIALLPGLWAQSPPSPKIEFDVASIRPLVQPNGRPGPCNVTSVPLSLSARLAGKTLSLHGMTLGVLIMSACGVRDYQFAALPPWATCRDQYEIIAKVPSDQNATDENLRLMLQALLADRFQLQMLSLVEKHHPWWLMEPVSLRAIQYFQ